ncbi:MAG: DUF4339 domain-containing protein [Verrucomicrobiota bacterium]
MWYCILNGQQLGPYDEERFNAMIAGGQVPPDTLVWREGQADWQPLAEVRSSFSAQDVCEVCQRPVGAENLIELNGTRACAACKPVVLQRMREGIPAAAPAGRRRRPVMVWVISIFYFIATPMGILSLVLLPMLASSNLPMSEAQRRYFQSEGIFDYLLAAVPVLLNLAAAILLLMLRRQAFYCFGAAFLLVILSFVYQIAFRGWLQTIGSQPGGLIGGGIGALFSIGINVAIVWYVWRLKETNVLR